MWKIEIKVNNFNIIFCLSHEITFFPINLRESEGVNRVRLLRQFAPGIEHKMKSWLSVWIVTKHAATRKLPKQGRPTQIPLRILFFSFFGFATRKFFFLLYLVYHGTTARRRLCNTKKCIRKLNQIELITGWKKVRKMEQNRSLRLPWNRPQLA